MSRQIDWNEPLSDDDRAWASQFEGAHGELIRINDAQYASQADSLAGDDEDDDEVKPYDQWTKDQLAAEDTKRELAVPSKAKKEDLIAILQADDDQADE